MSSQTTHTTPIDERKKATIVLIHNKPLVFLLEDAKYLRSLGIVGVFTGTLPSAPQQNLYMGLPLLLMIEEMIWLVLKGHAVVVPGKDYIQKVYQRISIGDLQILDQKQEQFNQKHIEMRLKKFEELQKRLNKTLKAPSNLIGDNVQVKIPLTPQHITDSKHEEVADSISVPITQFLASAIKTYPLYEHLKSSEYYMLPGMRFGGRYVAYPGDPLRYHSHLIVNEVEWEEDIGLLRLVGGGRLSTGVKKVWCIGSSKEVEEVEDSTDPEDKEKLEEIVCYSVEWSGFG
ncbi:hypothetical protein WICPIJ_007936 [Wickerhamomyces pijperi]|uniref:tRNA-splicing endonuclease subunit Sen34 n=1 Tax=Wickerhamomyces pijperi TaxID=599730 RepID=A0A9P8Q1M4_WICPI|nr:hypothetical protein WICPIJ_007936 [Wickerhamomyces pijperi]